MYMYKTQTVKIQKNKISNSKCMFRVYFYYINKQFPKIIQEELRGTLYIRYTFYVD